MVSKISMGNDVPKAQAQINFKYYRPHDHKECGTQGMCDYFYKKHKPENFNYKYNTLWGLIAGVTYGLVDGVRQNNKAGYNIEITNGENKGRLYLNYNLIRGMGPKIALNGIAGASIMFTGSLLNSDLLYKQFYPEYYLQDED